MQADVRTGMYVNYNFKSQNINITHSIMNNSGTTVELFDVYFSIFTAYGNDTGPRHPRLSYT